MFNIDKNKFLIALLIFILAMLLLNTFFNLNSNDKIDYLKGEIEKTNTQIDAVYEENNILNSRMEDFKTEIREIDNGIEINNNKIENLNKYEKDQINSFANYGNVEWEKYFADRYKQ
jgi:septal ring factor EnvC (AmiA/AmiB activator)